jgi:hypothetical protein
MGGYSLTGRFAENNMQNTRLKASSRPSAILALILAIGTAGAQGDVSQSPKVWSYGTKSCEAYVIACKGWDIGQQEQIVEYLRYQEWFSGLATGLTLATGMDALNGADVSGAMRRMRDTCERHPDKDFFNASMSVITQLGKKTGDVSDLDE